MTALLAILRFALPLFILVVSVVLFWHRFKNAGKQSDRIDVDSKVVNSEPTKVNLEDYEPSEVYVKKEPYDSGDTKES